MSNMREPVLKAVADVVREHVGKAFTALRDRISDVDSRLKHIEVESTVKAFGPTTNELIDARIGIFQGKLDGIEATIKALPKPEKGEPGIPGPPGKDAEPAQPGAKGDSGSPGKDAPPVDVEAIIKAVVAKIPVPKDGQSIKGDPGNDAPPVDEDALARKILAKIPVPQNGKDAEPVDEEALAAKILSKITVPKDGINGKDGLNGKDAPAVDIKALSDDLVQKVLGLIPVPKDGRDGNDGESPNADDIVKAVLAQIPPPIPGKDGKDIDAEALNVRVASEVAKAIAALPKPAAGRDGRDGRIGEPGEPGKDALEMDIINGIDETVSYQRGIFAKHRNGLFRAYRTTDPVVDKDFEGAGWMCIVPGVVDVVESTAQDQRTIIRTHELSDGSLITTKYKTPALIYRGVFKEGIYEAGDAVTNAGAMWICGELTTDKPGMSKAWTLAVKRGSDGKDLRSKDDDYPVNGKGGVYLGAKR